MFTANGLNDFVRYNTGNSGQENNLINMRKGFCLHNDCI